MSADLAGNYQFLSLKLQAFSVLTLVMATTTCVTLNDSSVLMATKDRQIFTQGRNENKQGLKGRLISSEKNLKKIFFQVGNWAVEFRMS